MVIVGCAGSHVCVECSLRDDCLRCYSVCRHSSSPVFNRDRRTLNRLPIYLGEDVVDIIHKKSVVSAINDMGCKSHLQEVNFGDNFKRYKSIMYHRRPIHGLSMSEEHLCDDPNFMGQLTREEQRVYKAIKKHTIRPFHYLSVSDTSNPKDYFNPRVQQLDVCYRYKDTKQFICLYNNLVDYKSSWDFKRTERASNYIRYIYDRRKRSKIKFQKCVRKIISDRVKNNFLTDYCNIYDVYSPYFLNGKSMFKKILHKQIIKKYDKDGDINSSEWCDYYDTGLINYKTMDDKHNLRTIRNLLENVGIFRIYEFDRFCRLYHEATEKTEKMFYIMKMGQLSYSRYRYNHKIWRVPNCGDAFHNYDFLGNYMSHYHKYFKDQEGQITDLTPNWTASFHEEDYTNGKTKYLDVYQDLYMIVDVFQYQEQKPVFRKKLDFDWIDDGVYNSEFNYWWKEMLHKQVSLPKINVVNYYYKTKVMSELKKTKRKTRNDCGRKRGKRVCKNKPTYMKMMAHVRAELKCKYHYNLGDPPYKGFAGLIHYIHIDLPNFAPWLKLKYLINH